MAAGCPSSSLHTAPSSTPDKLEVLGGVHEAVIHKQEAIEGLGSSQHAPHGALLERCRHRWVAGEERNEGSTGQEESGAGGSPGRAAR